MAYDIRATVETSAHGTGGSLNMRAQASTSASLVTTIPNNSTIYVSTLSGTWLPAKYGTYTGYVMGQFIREADAYSGSTSTHPQTIGQAFGSATIGTGYVTQGNAVRNVQICVEDLVWPPVAGWVDGYWGPKTMQAVKDFQGANGMSPVDGIVGSNTKNAFWEQYEEKLKSSGFIV